MHTLRDVWESSFWNFIVLGKPPAVEDWKCCYITTDGRRCAFGLLMDHEEALASRDPILALNNEYSLFSFDNPPHARIAQRYLHDGLCDLEKGCWKYSTPLRASAYSRFLVKTGLKVGFVERTLCYLIHRFAFWVKKKDLDSLKIACPCLDATIQKDMFGLKVCG